MKIHNSFEQGSLLWLQARAGVVSASEFHNIVTPDFLLRKGEMLNTYLASKLAEKWIGGPLPGFSSFPTEQGSILESEARPFLELELDTKIDRAAWITTDDGRAGCSPDGVIGKDGDETGVEIKCPQATNHVKWLLGKKVPDDKIAQVYFSLYVTGWKLWQFFSYHRGYPLLHVNVYPDKDIFALINNALKSFLARFDAGWDELCKLNGGPPARPEPPKPQLVNDDIIP